MPISLNRRRILTGATAVAGLAATGVSKFAFANGVVRDIEYGPRAGIAKLDSNENPYGPSPGALQALYDAGKKGAYYINESAQRLKEMIAERHGVTTDHITLSSGSSGALTFLAVAASKEGNILGPDLFWDTTSRMAERQGGKIVRIAKSEDLAIDLDALEKATRKSVSLVHVTNPNNPTGLLLEPGRVEAFCRRVAPRAIVLLDEAYNELTDDPTANTMVHLVREGLDVVVARTFSKIYGMAGLRVGYLIAQPERIEYINNFGLGSYGMNQPGVAAAVASYNDEAFLAYAKAKAVEGREMISAALKENGLSALPTATNFMFVDLGKLNANDFRQAMAKRKVMIRGIYRDYDNWSRVSMGYLHDVEQYVAALPGVLEELGA